MFEPEVKEIERPNFVVNPKQKEARKIIKINQIARIESTLTEAICYGCQLIISLTCKIKPCKYFCMTLVPHKTHAFKNIYFSQPTIQALSITNNNLAPRPIDVMRQRCSVNGNKTFLSAFSFNRSLLVLNLIY